VAARIEAFLGQPLSVPRAQQIEVQASVAAAAARFHADIVVTTQAGRSERQLDHEDCARLAEATAFVVALAIDPERMQGRPAPGDVGAIEAPPSAPSSAAAPETMPAEATPAPVRAPAPCPVCPPRSDVPPAHPSAAPAPRPPPWSAGIEGLMGAGALPELGPGAGVHAAWAALDRLRIGGHVRWWAPQRLAVPGHEEAQLRLELAAGGVGVCVLPMLGQVEVRTCAASLVGAMSGVGVHVTEGVPRRDRWSALVGQARLAFWIGRYLGLTLAFEGGPALDRPRFGVTAAGGNPIEVHRAGPWVANGSLGIEVGSRADLPK
jgi:hypothetical protein